ncbi:isopentenyl-diphosphate delta-isomerase [Pullulanibacillus camelliae]|uniref:Isopentenyl-diphosphate delta-isomerase n=1 Tax=Pullulanibacillus camelliae TaxID=1707096 RepID=A0A8J2VKC8_9BACL|nr:type 2 isopentenyl-diphosphate Delta-isomerase [Pullulanibacillus camelliae]GGE29933.1 isopentenyl-diphosphate delta-isomerase [Pullulanibacillus camelliae]
MADNDQQREDRKDEHVRLALAASRSVSSHFDDIVFVHRSLPHLAVKDVCLQVNLFGRALACPLYINAMTGGSQKTGSINEALATIASATGMAMAVGSQHAGLRKEELASTYRVVRKANPKGVIFANVGADVSADTALKVIDMIEADALQIHVNVPQELVMPEGERDFSEWLQHIEDMVKRMNVPVIVKEVGFGMSKETLHTLMSLGVQYVDISGRGGTNFIGIENRRRAQKEYSYISTWGQTTAIALLEAQAYRTRLTYFASGGVRHPLDMTKCLALGAKAVGIASPVLRVLQEQGVEQAVEVMLQWQEQLKVLWTMLGAKNSEELLTCPIVVMNEVKEWCDVRQIDVTELAQR